MADSQPEPKPVPMREEKVLVQQIYSNTSARYFDQEVNRLLLDGWRIVPGSFQVQSFEDVPDAGVPAVHLTPRGTTFRRRYFIAIEMEERRLVPA